MNADTYRHPDTCREVWLRLANRFPASYTVPPAKVCGTAREALAAVTLAHGNSPQRTALAFRDWLADTDELKTKDFETALREFARKVEREGRQYED